MRKITAFLTVALMSLAFAAPAFGQSATEDAYGGAAGIQQFGGGGGGNDGTGAVPVADTSSSGSLPFTGLEVGLIALAGVGLVGTGFVIRRVSRSGTEA